MRCTEKEEKSEENQIEERQEHMRGCGKDTLNGQDDKESEDKEIK